MDDGHTSLDTSLAIADASTEVTHSVYGNATATLHVYGNAFGLYTIAYILENTYTCTCIHGFAKFCSKYIVFVIRLPAMHTAVVNLKICKRKSLH